VDLLIHRLGSLQLHSSLPSYDDHSLPS